MQNFISFLMVLIFFENFENFSQGASYHLLKCPFKGQLSLAGYAQSSVPGELSQMYNTVIFILIPSVHRTPRKPHSNAEPESLTVRTPKSSNIEQIKQFILSEFQKILNRANSPNSSDFDGPYLYQLISQSSGIARTEWHYQTFINIGQLQRGLFSIYGARILMDTLKLRALIDRV